MKLGAERTNKQLRGCQTWSSEMACSWTTPTAGQRSRVDLGDEMVRNVGPLKMQAAGAHRAAGSERVPGRMGSSHLSVKARCASGTRPMSWVRVWVLCTGVARCYMLDLGLGWAVGWRSPAGHRSERQVPRMVVLRRCQGLGTGYCSRVLSCQTGCRHLWTSSMLSRTPMSLVLLRLVLYQSFERVVEGSKHHTRKSVTWVVHLSRQCCRVPKSGTHRLGFDMGRLGGERFRGGDFREKKRAS